MKVNKTKLANIIVEEIKKEFAIKHLSKNLINTIKIFESAEEVRIEIPAQTYDMLVYQKQGVIVHNNQGSYASALDKEGSQFYVYKNGDEKSAKLIKPGNHQGYIENVIQNSLRRFMAEEHLKESKREDNHGDK